MLMVPVRRCQSMRRIWASFASSRAGAYASGAGKVAAIRSRKGSGKKGGGAKGKGKRKSFEKRLDMSDSHTAPAQENKDRA